MMLTGVKSSSINNTLSSIISMSLQQAFTVNLDHINHFSHLPSPVTFREDINGLRAWAVKA